MGEGPDEKVTVPALPAVDPWARVDRLETKLDAHVKESAERFGKLAQKLDDSSEKCSGDHAMLRDQVAASANVARGLDGRFKDIEAWKPGIEDSVSKAREEAADAKRVADACVAEMKGTAEGMMRVLKEAEKATEAREDAKRAERDEAAREAKAERDAAEARRVAATTKHEARFESLGDAVARQAAGIVTVGGAVTRLTNRILLALVVVGLVGIVGVAVVVVTVLASRPAETVVAPRHTLGEPK